MVTVGTILVYTFLKPGQEKHVILFLIIAGHTRDDGSSMIIVIPFTIVDLQDVSSESSR